MTFVYLLLGLDGRPKRAFRNVQALLNSLDTNVVPVKVKNSLKHIRGGFSSLAEIQSPEGLLGFIKRMKLQGEERKKNDTPI